MDGLAKERPSRNGAAATPLMKQPGAVLRAGQLTPIRQLVDESKLPAAKVRGHLLDCQRLSGREKERGGVPRKIQVLINIFSVRFFCPILTAILSAE